MDWSVLGSGIGLLVLNCLLFAFRWGQVTGKFNNRLNHLEEKVGNPSVLPECGETFTGIKEGLSNLDGKVEAILGMMKDGGK